MEAYVHGVSSRSVDDLVSMAELRNVIARNTPRQMRCMRTLLAA
jgi:hypothetical protein